MALVEPVNNGTLALPSTAKSPHETQNQPNILLKLKHNQSMCLFVISNATSMYTHFPRSITLVQSSGYGRLMADGD